MRVRATQLGYYNHRRWREGDVFEMSESAMKVGPDKKPILPKWVEQVSGSAKPSKSKKQKPPFPGAKVAGVTYESRIAKNEDDGFNDDYEPKEDDDVI